MLHLDCSPALISASLGISLQTLHHYVEKYQQVGLAAYLSDSYQTYTGKLNEEQQAIWVSELNANLYICSKEICAFILATLSLAYKRV